MDFVIIPIYFGKNFRPTDSDTNFKASALDNKVTNLCASNFFEELRPFGCSSVSAQVGEYVILDEIPLSWKNIPIANGFTDAELQALIRSALDRNIVPAPEAFPGKQAIYCGIIRQGQKHFDDKIANGRNDYRFDWTKPGTSTLTQIAWAWAYQGDNLDDSTLVYFHEVVEGISNYLGFGERCDPCHYAKLKTTVSGVEIEPYLNSFGHCVAPRPFSQSIWGTPVCMAWKGQDDSAIYWSTLSAWPDDNNVPQTRWDKPARVPGVGTSHSPALAWHEGQVWMAWKGMNEDESIYWSVFTNGEWEAQRALGFAATSSHPALASYNGHLYLVWKGAGDDNHIWWSRYRGYGKWDDQQVIDGRATSSGVNLVAGQRLHMAWRGAGDDQTIWYSSYGVGDPAWSDQAALEGKTTDTPSLALIMEKSEGIDRILLTWKGADDNYIWQSVGENGIWTPQFALPDVATSQGPVVVGNGTEYLWRVWRGAEEDTEIWWSTTNFFDAKSWLPQKTVGGSMYPASGPSKTTLRPALALLG
jgi:hypothetical protein